MHCALAQQSLPVAADDEQSMTEIAVGSEQVARIDETLERLAAVGGQDVRLRFDNHWSPVEPGAAVLAGALLGSLGNQSLVIDAVDEGATDRLVRVGLASALKRRSGRTQFQPTTSALDDDLLGLIWTPGALEASEAMFAPRGAHRHLGPFAPDYATFVDAHLSSTADGTSDVMFLVRRWLTRRLLGERSELSEAAAGFVDTVGFVVDQFIANVREHALTSDGRAPHSLLHLGFGDGADTRLVCSVVDTGAGLDRTLRVKVDADTAALAPEVRVRHLLAGDIAGWGAARGIGLARVAKLVHSYDAEMFVATEGVRVRLSGDGDLVAAPTGFALQGTVVSAAFPLPAQ